jgi:hypothetical protein
MVEFAKNILIAPTARAQFVKKAGKSQINWHEICMINNRDYEGD